MTGDEMQRAIEFLLTNQASFERRFEESSDQWKTRFEESNKRFEMQTAEINRQIAHTDQVVEALAETQTEFTQTVLGFIMSQNAVNDSSRKELDELAQAQKRTEQAILDLTRTVNNFINFSSGNGNSPRE